MSYTLYTAPSCLRCAVVKSFMAERGIGYEAFDFKADKDIFNTFYRTNRPLIYRNPEGVEFPIMATEENGALLVKQGSGEVVAYLLSGHKLEACVTRSDLLHGWISGLYVSQCPTDQDENFITLVSHLAKSGLKVYLQTDGRRPDLLEKVLATGAVTRLVLNIYGPSEIYEALFGQALEKADLAKTLELVKKHPSFQMRLVLKPLALPGGPAYLTPEQAALAAKMLAEAGGDIKLPFVVYRSDEEAEGLTKLEDSALFGYRSKMRNHLVATDLAKPENL